MLSRYSDPIAAIATAPGRGAVGIVRLSGKGLAPLVQQLLARELAPRVATYMPFPGDDGQPLDHGLALWFPAPHSYTGEDVLELQAHGGSVVLQMLLALARNPQARLQRLAQELELSAPTVSVGIRRLEALGLVERQSDTTDQRAIRLQLTATGEQLCELARDASRARAQILLDRLKPPEQKQLLTLLERALGLPVTRTTTAPDHEAQAQKKTTTAAESGQLSLFS